MAGFVTPMPHDAHYRVLHTTDAPAELLEGDASVWDRAQEISWGPAPYLTRFRAVWSTEVLAVRFVATDPSPWSTFRNRDDRLWEEEVVEIFLDPDRRGRDYAELEISPANVICDVRMRSPWPDKIMDLVWNFPGVESRVVHRRDGGGQPLEWMATAVMPWRDFATLPCHANLPPRPGDRWAFNVFRIKRPGGPALPEEGAVLAAWSPTGGPSFHAPAAFRPLWFDPPR